MIFSEVYSVYYNTVTKVLEAAFRPGTTEQDLQQCVMKEAFSESALTILPALKSGRWPLLYPDGTPTLHHAPTRPMTLLEKRWLKAIAADPRMKLFGVTFPELEDVAPLFTPADYKIYDQYLDGDPFEDETYIRHFRLLRAAMLQHRPVRIVLLNRRGHEVWVRCFPVGFEYSVKDDKIRVLASKCKYREFNLARITHCEFYPFLGPWKERGKPLEPKELTLLIKDERNALERAMLHFAHFEKQAERLSEDCYRLRLNYYGSDETEMVIRVLSFGPRVQVLAPQHFVELIKERLRAQKICGLR